jgi:Regulator of chromosome condensation (RCC1) repeat
MIVSELNTLGTARHTTLNRASFFCGLVLLLVLPAVVVEAAAVTKISAGVFHSVFLESDGSLWGMGGDPHGQLGAGFGVAGSNAPGLIVSNNVTTISAGTITHFLSGPMAACGAWAQTS